MPEPTALPPALNAFAAHRSIRHFLPQPLAQGHLDLIVEAGRPRRRTPRAICMP